MHASYEMKMPVEYTEVSADEMEYDGGLWNFIVGIAATAVGIIATVAGDAGLIDKKYATAINMLCAGIGIITGVGGIVGSFSSMANAGANVGKALWAVADFHINSASVVYNTNDLAGMAVGVFK